MIFSSLHGKDSRMDTEDTVLVHYGDDDDDD